jgi:hypothetical protein
MAKDKTPTGAPLKGGMMHQGMKSYPRTPTGTPLPKANMDFVRKGVGEDAPTIGPRNA